MTKGTGMGTTSKPRRTQVEALDDLTAEIRTSNLLAVLALGVNALEHETKTTPASEVRVARRNEVRAQVRTALRIEVGS